VRVQGHHSNDRGFADERSSVDSPPVCGTGAQPAWWRWLPQPAVFGGRPAKPALMLAMFTTRASSCKLLGQQKIRRRARLLGRRTAADPRGEKWLHPPGSPPVVSIPMDGSSGPGAEQFSAARVDSAPAAVRTHNRRPVAQHPFHGFDLPSHGGPFAQTYPADAESCG
jgi:hypothetical protein